jgi:hypothetical protein
MDGRKSEQRRIRIRSSEKEETDSCPWQRRRSLPLEINGSLASCRLDYHVCKKPLFGDQFRPSARRLRCRRKAVLEHKTRRS